jgi:hypothetical protein
VVTSEGDDAREGFAGLGDAWLVGGGGGAAGQEGVVTVFDLLQGVGVVVGCDGDVAAVEDFAPEVEGVGLEGSGRKVLAFQAVKKDIFIGRRILTHYTRR